MSVTLVPDRVLEKRIGLDDDENFTPLWRTAWVLRGEIVAATPWVRSPRKAIGLADEMDRGYEKALAHTA
jgi:hypothetical protein